MPVFWIPEHINESQQLLQLRLQMADNRIALRLLTYPFGGLHEKPVDLPDHLAASEAAEPSGEEP